MEKFPFPKGVYFEGKTTIVDWTDGTSTKSTPSGRDKFDLEMGVLWALCKRYISTSKIVHAVYSGTEFFEMEEREVLWHIIRKFMKEDHVVKVLQAVGW